MGIMTVMATTNPLQRSLAAGMAFTEITRKRGRGDGA